MALYRKRIPSALQGNEPEHPGDRSKPNLIQQTLRSEKSNQAANFAACASITAMYSPPVVPVKRLL
jgi:hypothetical protein